MILQLSEFTITVRSLRLVDGGSFVDLDDEVADVLDDKEAVWLAYVYYIVMVTANRFWLILT